MELLRQYQRISRLLSLDVKLRIRTLVQAYVTRARFIPDTHVPYSDALAPLRPSFPSKTVEENNVLVFYFLALVTASKEAIKNDLDSLSEMGEEQQLRLQMIMERMNKASSAASNLLGKLSGMTDDIIRNIK